MIMTIAVVSWFSWAPYSDKVGVAVGDPGRERLMAVIPESGCADGMAVYRGLYGDIDKAMGLVERSKICSEIDGRNAKLHKSAPQ